MRELIRQPKPNKTLVATGGNVVCCIRSLTPPVPQRNRSAKPMRRPLMKIALCVTTLLAWLGFIYLDHLWNQCLSHVVAEGRKTYGEIYGPLTILRPTAMYLALALSLTGGVCNALSKKAEPKS
jgi:hypothetical protein